jgi:hypothetical protein
MMMHRSTTGSRRAKRVLVSLAASACLIVGSPFVGVSSAASGPGAHKPVSASFGDCKNNNNGKHHGYDCPVPVVDPPTVTTNDGGTVVTPDPGPIYVS